MKKLPKQLSAGLYLDFSHKPKISKRKIRNICNTYIDRAISEDDFNNLVNKLYEEINKGE